MKDIMSDKLHKIKAGKDSHPGLLLVDDERNILMVLKEIMEMSGYRVFTAENGLEALNFYRENRPVIDLVIMDMIMPVMDGLTAFSEIRRIDARQKIIIVSGYSQQEDMEFIRDHANGFIRKPFNIQDFLRQVNGVLHYS